MADVSGVPSRDRVAAWKSPLAVWTVALTLFLAVSGVVIWLAPGSAYGEALTLLHTAVALAFLIPYVVYQYRHLMEVIKRPLCHVALLGWTSGTLVLVAVVSGIVLTVQAVVGPRISYSWDLVHTVSGVAATVLLPLHLGLAAARVFGARQLENAALARPFVKRLLGFGGGVTVALLAAGGVVAAVAPEITPDWQLPEDYGFKYGDRAFAPSLARTRVHGVEDAPIDPKALSGSARCGTSGCHEEIAHEWAPSAHRFASRSLFFQAIQGAMAANNGPESTRYCAGCHDPIALFSGSKNIYDEDLSSPGADEGISCIGCHSIVETDVKGNAAYVIEPQDRVLFEGRDDGLSTFLSEFLIRALPRPHKEAWSRDLLRTPEFCGACHKQFIDEEINDVGWVQLQNQYDNWRKSRWFDEDEARPDVANAETSISCRECHMRLTASTDPARGDIKDYNRTDDDGKHRNHRFIGANQWHPTLHDLPGAEEQVRLTNEWLRGETEVPEIADKWVTGPAIPVELILPKTVKAGEPLDVRVVITNHKTGHDFPTGPLDIIQSWIELVVTDADGQVVYESGLIDEKGYLSEGAFIFKAEGIDRHGNLIDKHNLWEMVGARFKRSLFPGYSDTARYEFTCPSALAATEPLPPQQETSVPVPANVRGPLTVKARLRYRKVDQTLIDFVFPDKGLTAPITDLSETEGTVEILQ